MQYQIHRTVACCKCTIEKMTKLQLCPTDIKPAL